MVRREDIVGEPGRSVQHTLVSEHKIEPEVATQVPELLNKIEEVHSSPRVLEITGRCSFLDLEWVCEYLDEALPELYASISACQRFVLSVVMV
jgi:hypothetical protein